MVIFDDLIGMVDVLCHLIFVKKFHAEVYSRPRQIDLVPGYLRSCLLEDHSAKDVAGSVTAHKPVTPFPIDDAMDAIALHIN
jgi:hypothetical protein